MFDELNELENILDEEIRTYLGIEEIVNEKKETLVKGELDNLFKLDEKIVNYSSEIETLESKRASLNKKMGKESMTLSEVIEKARLMDKKTAEKLIKKRSVIQEIIKKITATNKTNEELVKHGLKMVESTILSIVNAVNPEVKSYNNYGQTKKNNLETRVSSIVREA